MSPSASGRQRVLFRVTLLFVALIFGWGLFLSGSPQFNRRQQFDRRRMEALDFFRHRLITHYGTQRAFPKTLTELYRPEPQSYTLSPFDPESGEPYEYRVVSATEFEICAVFNEESPKTLDGGPQGYNAAEYREHPAGRFCVTGSAPKVQEAPRGTTP